MNIYGRIDGVEEAAARWKRAPQESLTHLRAAVVELSTDVLVRVRDQYLGGKALHRRTGEAQESVRQGIRVGRYSILGTVYTDLYYLRFWEYGFTVPERTIESSKGAMSYEQADHPFWKAHQKEHHEIARPSFTPGISDMAVRIRERLGPIIEEMFG